MRIKLGKSLRNIRRSSGLKQEDFANLMSVNRSTYSGWENDRGCPTFVQVYKLLHLLDHKMESFVQLIEKDNSN